MSKQFSEDSLGTYVTLWGHPVSHWLVPVSLCVILLLYIVVMCYDGALRRRGKGFWNWELCSVGQRDSKIGIIVDVFEQDSTADEGIHTIWKAFQKHVALAERAQLLPRVFLTVFLRVFQVADQSKMPLSHLCPWRA